MYTKFSTAIYHMYTQFSFNFLIIYGTLSQI